MSPYTDDEEAITILRVPALLAASRRLSVPPTFTSFVVMGSFIDLGTEGSAAW